MKGNETRKFKIGKRLNQVGLVHTSEAEEQLGVSSYLINKLEKKGALKKVKIGKCVFILQSSIDDYLKSLVEDVA